MKIISSNITKRIFAISLLIVSILNLIFSILQPVRADIFLGTNDALGSPILNPNAVSDDWNKYESVVWGIFLGNFCIPFVDDYESAFNLSSMYGSKGRGLKALNFGTGSDPENSKVIKELVTYAINMQKMSVKKVYVSYNTVIDGKFTSTNSFGSVGSETANTSNPGNPGNLGNPGNPGNPGETATTENLATYQTAPREAKLSDLFVKRVEYTNGASVDNNSPWASFNEKGHFPLIYEDATSKISEHEGSTRKDKNYTYPSLEAVTSYNVPTFAIPKSSNDSTNGYEVVLDYTNSYDFEMAVASMVYGLTCGSSDYRAIAKDNMFGSGMMDSPLYIDAFGNICVKEATGNRFIIVIPAAANQYITKERSINLLNSLIFNATTSSNSIDNVIMSAGSHGITDGMFIGYNIDSDNFNSGGLAFNNNSSHTKNGGLAIFYDTDTIVTKRINEGKEINSGEILKELYDTDITDPSHSYNLKIEPLNAGAELLGGLTDSDNKDLLISTLLTSSSLANTLPSVKSTKILSELNMVTGGGTEKLFTESFIVPVNFLEGYTNSGNYNEYAVFRTIPNFLYTQYKRGSSAIDGFKNGEINYILNKSTPQEMMDTFVLGSETKTNNNFTNQAWAFFNYMEGKGLYKTNPKQNKSDLADFSSASFNIGGSSDFLVLKDIASYDSDSDKVYLKIRFKYDRSSGILGKLGVDNLANEVLAELTFGRNVKVYQSSPVLESAMNVLGVKDGTEFSLFAPNIYYTYLKWYNVDLNKLTGEPYSDLNPNIIDPDTALEDPDELGVPSEEEMEREILNYTYLSLHPTAGREYRNQILMSKLASSIYSEYQKIVYGGSDTYYYSTVTTKSNTGFLNINTYADNPWTAPFIRIYPTVAIVFIGLGVVLTIVIGIIKRRKASWTMLGVIAIVTVVLVLPSTGEIVPLASNNIVQDLFEDKMTFWSISEQATNDARANSTFGRKLDESEDAKVSALVNGLKSVYLDRYLNIKQDISNKVGNKTAEGFKEVQNYKSVRWMLPTIMREYTNSKGTADYVYVPLGDKLDDCANMYFMFEPDRAATSGALTVKMGDAQNIEPYKYNNSEIYNNTILYYSGYIDLKYSAREKEYHYRSKALSDDYTGNKPHTYFYIIDSPNLITNRIDSSDFEKKSFNDWVKEYAVNLSSVSGRNERLRNQVYDGTDGIADVSNTKYYRYDRSTMNEKYGFLWATESPLTYFYSVVNDTFDPNGNLGTLAMELQGSYTKADNDKEYRATIMASPVNGEVRDFLDLENMFTNMIPYMYSVQLMAGGYNGTGGVFGDETIGDRIFLHKDQRISWLFRSNWVTKIMENPEYNSSANIRDSQGNKYTVENQLLPQCYPGFSADIGDKTARRMVFSTAQMKDQGLSEGDLSLVELKCIELNSTMMRKWTLLLNYLSVSGISREVLYRQMALDSTLEFDKSFSSAGVLYSKHNLFPTSLDLRSISFDSIMKLIILNITHNSAYIYGDSMDVLIDDSSLATQISLLIAAIICVAAIPAVRDLSLAFIFYLGFVMVIRELLRDPKEQMKNSIGYMGCNMLALLVNVVYLGLIKLLININVKDQMIEVGVDGVSLGSPLICFWEIIGISIAYIIASVLIIIFCLRHYKDMGFSAFRGLLEMAASNVSSGFEKILTKMGEEAAVSDAANSGYSTRSIADPANVSINNGSGLNTNNNEKVNTSNQNTTNNTTEEEINYNDEYIRDIDQSSSKYVDGDVEEVNQTIARGNSKERSKESKMDTPMTGEGK